MDEIGKHLNRLFEEEFLGTSATESVTQDNVLTIDTLAAALKLLEKPVMWYADTKWLERGKAYKCAASPRGWYPEYYIFNKDDFIEMKPDLEKRYYLQPVAEYVPDLRMVIETIEDEITYYPHSKQIKPITNVST